MNFIKKNVVSSCFAALFIILATVSSVFAIDIPGGDITVDETWTLTNSPYNILGNTVVQSGVTLTIQAGVEVRFNSEIFLEIHGKLVARGTEGNEIRFTSNTGTPASGDWEYIYFTGTSADDDATYDGAGNYIDGSILEYCIIEYAGSTYEGALRLDGAHPFINNCTIQNNFYNGIYAYNLDNILKITNCIIINNSSSESGHSTYGGGIYAAAPDSSSPKLEMTDNTISNNGARGNGGGLYVHFSTNSLSEIIITNNTITNNNTWAANTGGGGVYLYSQGQISISENEFSDNNCGDSGGAIYIHHQTNSEPAIVSDNNIENNAAGDHGGGIYFHGYNDSGPSLNNNNKITNNLIINNTTSTLSPGGWGGGIFITGAYAEGNIIMCNSTVGSTSSHGGGICVLAGDVRNNIIYDNTAAHAGGGIYITTLQGNSVENNIIAGNTSQAAGGVWLSVHHIGASIVANNVIYNNNVTSHAGGLHLAWLYADDTVNHNIIVHNSTTDENGSAIYLGDGNHDGFVMGNSFIYNEDCPYEAYTDILETSPRGVSILNNYWGTTDTEIIDSKIWDRYDDGLLTYIYYDPILTETDITNPISPPYNLHITGIDNGEISISWDANPESDCDGYRVYWDSDGEWPYANSVDNGTSTTYTITGLAPGTYLIGVSSYDSTYAAVADDPLTHINEKQTQGVESWYAEISADPSPAPLISSDPASFDFEAVMLGDSSSAQTLTITNIGTANLEIGSITVDGDDSSEFTTQNDSCSGQTIEPSGSLTIEIIFTPASSGAKSAYLNIPSNDSYTGDLQIELNGIGGINPDISITPSSLDFGTVALGGGTATRDITITNTGSADLTIIDLSVAGTDGDEFSQTNDYSAPLTPDSSCTVTVGLSPLSTGAKTATLSITSDDPDEPIVDVSLSANVTDVLIYPVNIISLSATPLCSTAPASVDFEIEASGGSGSYDYSWDFGDTTTSDEEDPTHTYDSAGTYSVIVTVSDHENPLLTASSELTITITDDLLPTLNVSISAAPVTGEAPLEVTFTATFEGASPPFDLEWDFGDGTTESQTTDSNTAEITHTYTSAGVYSALLEATSRSESGFDTLPMRIAISISAINNSSEGNGTSNDCGCSSNAYAYSTNIGKGSIVRIASYMLNNFIIMLFPLSIITLHRLIRSRKKRR